MPTLSDYPPVRTHAVVVVTAHVVDVAIRRNAKTQRATYKFIFVLLFSMR